MAIECFLEVRNGDGWCFVGDMENHVDLDTDEPISVPSGIFSTHLRLYELLFLTGADVRSNDEIMVITSSRGLPDDLSNTLDDYVTWCGKESLSCSWFTAKELFDFKLESHTIKKTGYVIPKVAHLFEDPPKKFPWDRWPRGCQVCDSPHGIKGPAVTWLETYAEVFDEFYELVPHQLAEAGSPDDVRLIVVAGY